MKITEKQVFIPALTAIIVGCFLYTCFRGVIHSRELFQMFLFTTEYFVEVCRMPGGFSEYLGRFINQFFYFPALGAVLYPLLIWILQYLSYKNMSSRSWWSLGLSLTVFGIATWYIMSTGATTGTLISTGIIISAVKISDKRRWISVLFAPLLFYACGMTAIIFPVILWLRTQRHLECISSLFIIICGCIALQILNPIKMTPAFLALNGYMVLIFVFEKCFRPKSGILQKLLFAFCAALTVCVYFPCRESIPETEEKFFEYLYLEEHRQWDRIVDKSESKNPEDALSMQIVNLALSQKGILLDKAFNYKRNRSECIWTKEADHHIFPLVSAEIFFYLDKPNLSQQYWFDLMQAIPSKEKSSRAYRRIAECNAISGNRESALKYASALSHTLFYRKWALDFIPEAKTKHINDNFFPDFNFEDILIYSSRNEKNWMALQYATLNALMAKDLETVVSLLNCFKNRNVPDCCQQAFILYWMQHAGNIDSLPDWISQNNKTAFNDFGKSKNDGLSAKRMYNRFKGSYLFYYVYYK